MGRLNFLHQHYVFLIAFIVMMSMEASAADEDRKVYIVYLGSLPKGEFSPMSQHLRVLDEVLEGSSSTDSLVRSYKRSFNGFAAKLTEKEREKLANKGGVVSVFENKILKLQTTRSWDFMGFSEAARHKPALESDVIVGVLDTGIWPESQSFSDKDFGPPPEKWLGYCSAGPAFNCNKKVIGARFYNSLNDTFDDSARDTEGHGSHTASIAAGNNVENVSLHGFAQGKARGAVPSARLAIYKVCGSSGCASADILAAFDDAISDGVDVIAISLGYDRPVALLGDPIAIGAFHAMARGILTVNSAGNEGPTLFSVSSVAPWMVSVAASTIDRKIIDRVVLGNGKVLTGTSFNYFTMNGSMYPLTYGNDTRAECNEFLTQSCRIGCLNTTVAKGKIVLCDSTYGDEGANLAGAAGAIKWDNGDASSVVPFPTIALRQQDLDMVRAYYNSTKKAGAKIMKSESVKDFSAPVVASFSSRGPNSIIPEIMKPDITAPGVDILAAYSPLPELADGISADYNILSGTSMSCPHVAGIAAYVKSVHPDWSASAIRSALMTTARPMKVSANQHGVLSFGSGHVDPVQAISPGLVYETSTDDYTKMLCNMGYNTTAVRLISGDNSSCPKDSKGSPKDLNYPSMTVNVTQLRPFKVEFPRTVTNVGNSSSTYKAEVVLGKHRRMKVEVNPSMLSFKLEKEKKSFVVTVTGHGMTMERPVEFATLVWSDGNHTVRTPIVVYTDMLID